MYARLIIGLVIVVISMIYLFAFAIPNVQRANEEVRLAQIEYDKSQAELDQSMDELNQSIQDIQNEDSIQ